MKTFFLILLFTLLAYGLYAQQEDFTYFNHRIDSLTSVYSTEERQEMVYINYFDGSNLTSNEKKKLIVKVGKLFEQKKYANLYRYGHRIIYDMWKMHPNNNSLEIKQELMELYLQYYFYPGTAKIIYSYPDVEYSYYSEKARKRIAEILENKKTEEEYKAWLNFEKSIHGNRSTSDYFAKQFIKGREIQNDTIFQQIRDSVYSKHVENGVKKDLESLQIEPALIRMIGLLDMKECIPALKQGLDTSFLKLQDRENNEHYWRPRVASYRYALARLGDKEQRQYIVDSFVEEFNHRDFSYFKDDEMIWKYTEVNYHSGKRFFPFSHGEGIPAELKTMSDIYPYVKNVPEELEYPDLKGGMEGDIQWAQLLYEWLTANKDTVEFDYEGEKRFPW